MAPVIHLVRHAQGYHNLNHENEQLPDPDLTPFGEEQCRNLRDAFPDHDKITHLVASPLRRTVYTCLHSFEPVVKKGIKVIALPDAQEMSLQPCDHGSDVEKIKAEFGEKVDFSRVQDGWNIKSPESKYYPDPAKLDARARDTRRSLRELAKSHGDDAQIVLVTHGGIVHFVTGDWAGIPKGGATGWKNTECRSYEFKDPSGADPEAALQELESSWEQRRGSQVALTDTENREMRDILQKMLEAENAADMEARAKAKAEAEGKADKAQ
ncbi:putative Phosphoglycerate mutase-like protein [Seiridium unicorne]|uniref:Phosphoglycerate mutase-like protein n=1 Tax=Seiridium unicorne TaxID=138068 RepID=A0ABR2UKE1_9PEZI